MTGYGSMQMMSCTFQEDGAFNIAAVEETAGSEGKLYVSGGRLFFADKSGYSGMIYEIGEARREITAGIDFAVSPDGKSMAVLEASQAGEEEVLTSLKICDIETGVSVYIAQNAEITGFFFSHNGGKIYYTDASITKEESVGEYKYGLFSYDIASASRQMEALCSTGELKPSEAPGKVFLIKYINEAANGFYATYTYELSM